VAISDSSGLGTLEIAEMEIGAHRKILDKSEDVYGASFVPDYSHRVLKVSVDELTQLYSLPRPDYLKIDVDGAEMEVLVGAQKSLAEVKSVFIEVTKEFLNSFAFNFFSERGFLLTKKLPVQDYPDLYNCVFSKQ
jgi:FkbM family methyltransferase